MRTYMLERRYLKQTWLIEQFAECFCIVDFYVCNYRQVSIYVLSEIAKMLYVDPKDLLSSHK